MTVNAELLAELSKKASPGPWVRSHHIIYAGYAQGRGNSGSLVGLMGEVKYLNHLTDPAYSSNNARFITALVNEYRAGRLVLKD